MKRIIPFQLIPLEHNGYHPLIEAEINSQKVMLVIDTGASRTVINYSCLEGLKPMEAALHEPFAAGINAQQFAVQPYSVPKLQLGEVSVGPLEIFATDLSELSNLYFQTAGHKIHGLLGCDFLKTYGATLNFQRKELTIELKAKNPEERRRTLR